MNEEKLQELIDAMNKCNEALVRDLEAVAKADAAAKRRLRWSIAINMCSMLVNAVLIGLLLAR